MPYEVYRPEAGKRGTEPQKRGDKTVIYSAPQGHGKTRHADDIMERLGGVLLVDDWLPSQALVHGAVHFTNATPAECGTAIIDQEPDEVTIIAKGWKLPF